MVRIRDRIWQHVEKTDEVWKCRFCDHVFAKGIAAQIVKCHLAGVGGPGTKFCSDVPGHVKMEARREINEGEKKRRIIMSTAPSSSSNVTVEVSPKNDGERMIEQETILRPRDGGVVERESDQEMIEAEFPAVMVKNGDSVCEICRDVFERRTPAKRMQWHLAEIGGSGDTICTSMPDDVKGAILQEITESKIKRRKTMPGSSHTEDVPTMSIEDVAVQPLEAGWSGITKALEDLHNEADHGVRDEKMVEVEDASVKDSREEEITGVPPGDLRQPTEKDHEQSGAEVEVPMVDDNQQTRESSSLTKRLVGDAFERNEGEICSWLMDDQVLRVGIYGMGGVGKTTLMRHIQTRLKGQTSFEVYWITISQDFSICKLQNLIAKKIGLNFSDEEDEVKRAKTLAQAMQAKGKCVLILDDIWNYFDVDEVGIPVGVNTCKLVLTTRLLKVCRQMDCSVGNTIQLQRLSDAEAWILFTQELGNYRIEVEELAKAVSRQCAGLPLGIRVMARSMKGICNVITWRNTLEELMESKVSKGHEMWEEGFSVLKFSYLRLNDSALQECLSYCALFPEDDIIDRNELIEYMIVEGIIDERKSRQAELDKGHTMLDTLENACLLEGDTENVWMHDLIRDMLILELSEGSKTLVEAGAQLKELPDVERWTEKLVRVSLMSNDIEVIPYSHTPRCPNLSTLLLCTNPRLKMMANSFFEQFQKLKILDLSWCDDIKKLPKSICDLVNLTALLLQGCRSLIHLPSLAKLEKLKKLDLNRCKRLEEMPEGVKFLLNLKYLDLSRSGIEEIGSGIIPMLSRLQVLKLYDEWGDSELSIRGSEVGELRMLETLHCRFSSVKEFGEYMKSRERSQQSPSDYSIFIQREDSYRDRPTISRKLGSRKFVSVTRHNFIDPLALPTDIEAMNIYRCYSTLYKRLFPPSLLASLLNLQEIRVNNWGAIEEIFAMNEGESGEWRGFPFSNYSTHSLSNHSLLNLKLIDIRRCHKLKKLFPPSLLPNLHNLQKISIQVCHGMEEIFSTDREEEDGQELLFDQPNLTGLHLPNLIALELCYLLDLRSIYKGAFICHSLQQIKLLNCPKLKRITFPLPQPSLQRIQVYPKEWWESLHWGEANEKNHLESLCVFKV